MQYQMVGPSNRRWHRGRYLYRQVVIALACLSALVGSYPSGAAPRQQLPWYQSQVPQAAVPEMRVAPILDGVIQPDEWRDAVSFTGLMNQQSTALPEPMQGRIWLGHDRERLYIGLRSALPPDGVIARVREHDHANELEGEDHWSVQLQVDSTTWLFFINSLGTFSDQRYTLANRGEQNRHSRGLDWASGAQVKAHMTETAWEVEMAIPFSAFGLEGPPPPGEAWRALFARNRTYPGVDSSSYGEWNGTAAHRMQNAGLLLFSGPVPAFQLVSMGPIEGGEFAPVVRLTNPSDQPRQVSMRLAVESGADVLHEERRQVDLAPGSTVDLSFVPAPIKLRTDWSGRVVIEADAGSDHLYSTAVQFAPVSPAQYRQYAKRWPYASPLQEIWELSCANYPYFDAMDLWVDTSPTYLPVDIRTADVCRVQLWELGGKKPLRSVTVPLTHGKGRAHWDDLSLDDGEYELRGELPGGHTVVHRFVRKKFPWEHNRLGISDTVYPPFRAIRTSSKPTRTFSPWGRVIGAGNYGLPGEMIATDETDVPGKTICGPMRLEVIRKGVRRGVIGSTKVESTSPGLVRLSGLGEQDGLRVHTESSLGYEGWFETTLTIEPTQSTEVDAIELVIPFGTYPDTIYGYRRSWFYGSLPQQMGEIWSNMGKHENQFTPALGIGNGDVALWWYADGDEDWRLDYSKASQSVTRDADGLNLRLRLVNVPTILDRPMTIRFAVLASPAKPEPENRRALEWGEVPYFHDTSGYGYWGNGIDSIFPGSDQDYVRVREAIDRWAGRDGTQDPPVILYNSGAMLGQGMEEYATFSGEWAGETPLPPQPEFPDSDVHAQVWWRRQLRQDWRSQPYRLGPAPADMVQSCVDVRIWYYQQNLARLGVNGYWFDNTPVLTGTNPSTGRAYVTADGRQRPRYSVFARHELMRRLFVISNETGIEPLNRTAYGPDFAFTQWFWFTEMDAYVHRGSTDLFETLERRRYYDIVSNVIGIDDEIVDPVGAFRAITRMRRAVPASIRSNVQDQPHATRSVIALCLLHDIGIEGGVSPAEIDPVKGILHEFDFFNSSVRFLPYWRNEKWAKFSAPNILVSLYVHEATGAKLGVLVNPDPVAATGSLRFESSQAGTVWVDAETGEPLPTEILVPPRDFRLIRTKERL